MAEDMRAISVQVKEKKAALLEKANLEAELAEKEALESRNRITADKQSLVAAIEQLEIQNKAIQTENEKSQKHLETLLEKERGLMLQLSEIDAVVRELVGTIRSNARDLDAMLSQSQQSALIQHRGSFLPSVVNQTNFPGMDDIQMMVDLLFDEINRTGEVRIENSMIVNRSGGETPARVLVLGNFTAAYQLPDETGFLIYSDQSRRLFALSRLPSSQLRKSINQYMAGKAEAVPVDISRGAALRQLAHRLSLWEQIPKGGPIVWPILFICALAVLIIIERLIFLFRMNINAEKLMYRLHPLISQKRWQECEEICIKDKNKPVPKVLLAGLCFRDMSREEMENSLQEAILGEVPRLERYLSTLGMLAAIAPLLGLLGTVTGMINTFHVITFYGTGDPRMMSGGISEALVTTMLGLSVAIPIMLCHTLLTRRIENIIGQMEEKSVAFVNSVFKLRNGP
jgi:biopolymer transport protein ExbB